MKAPIQSATAAALVLGAALCWVHPASTAEQKQTNAPGSEVFAVVGTTSISFAEYEAALATGMRQKFYHARPPEREIAAFQREVGERMVNRVLLVEEAKRRSIGPDKEAIKRTIDGYDKRYADSPQWKANRDKMLAPIVAQLEANSAVEVLEKRVRNVPMPSEREARAHYGAHPEQFTEPEQVRLSIILLKVDPSSPKVAWEQARSEAEEIHKRLQRGSSFAELARLHSADPSAEKGGDLGYVHRGMLPDAIQSQVIDSLTPGQVSAPVGLLEGIAIVRLEDRKVSKLRSFEEVKARAADLLRREQGEKAWNALIAELRRKASIKVDESRFLPLAAETTKAGRVQAPGSVPATGAREEQRVSGAKAGG